MTATVQTGTILIDAEPRLAQVFALESEPYSGKWNVLKGLDGFALDRKIHAAGWNFFFMAAEAKVMFFGAATARKVQDALKRILGKLRPQNFNCLEVTGIVAKRFWGSHTLPSPHARGTSNRAASSTTSTDGGPASETRSGPGVDRRRTRGQKG